MENIDTILGTLDLVYNISALQSQDMTPIETFITSAVTVPLILFKHHCCFISELLYQPNKIKPFFTF